MTNMNLLKIQLIQKKIQDNKRRFRINKTGVIANLIFILELICVKKIIKSIEYGDSELATYF